MPLLEVADVSKWFGGEHALDGADLSLAGGRVHALLGGNGSGTSTLIKIVAGLQPANGGSISIGGRTMPLREWGASAAYEHNLRFVHQDPGLLADASVAENICMGRGWSRTGPQIRWRRVHATATRALEALQIDINPRAKVSSLPYGKRTLVAIARALADLDLSRGRGVLVLDEPTATLPHDQMLTVLDLVRRVAASGNAVVFVSHRIDEVLAVADDVTILRDGRVVAARPCGELDRSQLIDAIVGHPPAVVDRPQVVQRASSGGQAPGVVLDVAGLSTGRLHDVSFSVTRGEILGVAGQADCGGDDLPRAMFGLCRRSGEITLSGRRLPAHSPRSAVRAGFAYVPSDRVREGVFGNMSIVENLAAGSYLPYFRSGILHDRALRSDATREMEQLQVRYDTADAAIRTLSGGNQQKVVLGRTLRRNPQVLLLNDPTQGVDVGAKRDTWQIIREYLSAGGCAVVFSTDYEELAEVTDRVLVLQRGRTSALVRTSEIDRQSLARMTYESSDEVGTT